MKVLGVSYGYHDSSACVVVDGQVVAASAEERFTRQKHDANFPAFAIDHCLARAGLSAKDVDQIVFHEDPHVKFARVLATSIAPFPRSRREFVNSMKSWLGRKLWSLNALSSRLDVLEDRISYLGHHTSHAVQAFMGSGFDEAAILVVDAVGDWASTALYRGEWRDGKPKVERCVEIAFPNSLGLVYSAVTAYLGFSPNDSECSTMALAGFGEPRFAGKLREVVARAEDRSYEVDQSYFHFTDFYRGPVSDRFVRELGPPRSVKTRLPFACFGEPGTVDDEAKRFADVAASVQLVLEERILDLCGKLHELVPSKNLCLAGGVSLNCVANERIARESPFERVWVPPDPGDGGTAVGVALYYDALHGGSSPARGAYGPYLGAEFDETDDVRMIEHVDSSHVARYAKRGVNLAEGTRFRQRSFHDDAELAAEVARRLDRGEIVGWCRGRAEFGPRALGNRSILVRPDDVALASRLSRLVKDRASFRPYAFSIAEEDAPRVLALEPRDFPRNRWMQFAVPVKEDARGTVRAALHVDGTTRVQICRSADNPGYHALLRAFGERFGVAAVLNTSFNASGYPIVSSSVEALTMFARTAMDCLVLNDTIVWKES